MSCFSGRFISAFFAVFLVSCAVCSHPFINSARAADRPVFKLTVKDHKFTPSHLDVPAGQRFLIKLSNQDETTDEFESFDLKFEKIAVSGATVTVHAGPLHPGTYKFFDDYHPDAVGTVTAR